MSGGEEWSGEERRGEERRGVERRGEERRGGRLSLETLQGRGDRLDWLSPHPQTLTSNNSDCSRVSNAPPPSSLLPPRLRLHPRASHCPCSRSVPPNPFAHPPLPLLPHPTRPCFPPSTFIPTPLQNRSPRPPPPYHR
eukprot:494426-Hanusia_phi.AAC.1